MKACISSTFKTNSQRMWEELQKPSVLLYIASPILKFKLQEDRSLPEKWNLEAEYKFKLFFIGLIPLGTHTIRLIEINKAKSRIVSSEHGQLAKVWNHVIEFYSINNQTIRYSDEIEIKAGILTFPIWLFALVFYRHRQRRWEKLLGEK